MLQKIILISILLFINSIIFAHPHMKVLSRSEFNFENDKITGVWQKWEFDEYFSSDIIMSYDIDNNGIFNKEEVEEIYNNAFISLKKFNFFTYLRVKDKRTSPKEVSNFSVYLNENKNIIYKFYINLEYLESNNFYLSVYDFSYFCACFYQEKDPVSFTGINNIKPEYSIDENEKYPIYYDPYAGMGDNTIHTKWEKGLSKIVVKEIHVKY